MIRSIVGFLVVLLLFGTGCQSLREVANLRKVDFRLDRVADARLAGVDLTRVQDYEDLTSEEVFLIATALTRGDLPLAFDLHVEAENPAENEVSARLVEMDWTLFLDDSETVSGVFDQDVLLPQGETRDVAVPIELDLVEFFGGNARDLVELALAVAGANGEPKRIRLRVVPTIDTPVGPIRYPAPITVVSREVGS